MAELLVSKENLDKKEAFTDEDDDDKTMMLIRNHDELTMMCLAHASEIGIFNSNWTNHCASALPICFEE